MKESVMSNCKDPENRSKKNCCCGGHNHSNAKKNKRHNATKAKINIRRERKWKQYMKTA